MTNNHKPEGYEVGRGKPPKQSQFKPGQSGNPGGRPKGRKRIFMSVLEEINKEISIVENGEPQKVLCGDAIAKRLISIALTKGDLTVLKMLLELEQMAESHIRGIHNNLAPVASLDEILDPFAQYNSHYEREAKQEADAYNRDLGKRLTEKITKKWEEQKKAPPPKTSKPAVEPAQNSVPPRKSPPK